MQSFERSVALAFVAIAALLSIDVLDDLAHGADLLHVTLEGSALLVSFTMLVCMLRKFVRRSHSMRAALDKLKLERDLWRQRSEQYIKGLGQAIDEQFSRWGLSPSEREVGLLILKGLSHKEIASLRTTSEATVRQQAAALYSKAKLENKSQLSAFFLEDLILPEQQAITLKSTLMGLFINFTT